MTARFATILTVLLTSSPARPAAPLRVLIISGQNNHDWKSTTPVLEKLYDDCPRFEADVTLEPAKCDAKMLAKYDLIFTNWTNWPRIKERAWGATAEKAVLDFVRGGKGFVVLHAASTPFSTWPEYRALVGSWWEMGRTGHGPYHEFKVTIAEADHPVTRGMKAFTIADELWHRVGNDGKLQPLCEALAAKAKGGSGNVEPVIHHRSFGKGRCFHVILGHDAKAIRNVALSTLLLRGAEWAATGKVTIPLPANWPGSADPFEKLATYKVGQSRLALTAVAELVRKATADPAARSAVAAKLTELLKSGATKDAKGFACEQLSIVGSDACVPAVAALLADAELSHMARFALERIPGEAAAAALRGSLDKASGLSLVGAINSVARRRDGKAVAGVAKHATAADRDVAAAALAALGRIGTEPAAAALADAQKKAPPELKRAAARGALECAWRLLGDGKADPAARIFTQLRAEDQPRLVRVSAFAGLLAAEPDKAPGRVVKALADPDRLVVTRAAEFVAASRGAEATRTYAAVLPKLPAAGKKLLLAALAERGDTAASAAVAAEAGDADPAVRAAALAALGSVGDASAARLLVRKATTAQDAERQAASGALLRLKADGVDAAILAAMKTAPPLVQVELIGVLSGRLARSAVGAMLTAAVDREPPVRQAAVAALAVLAGPDDLPALVKLLGKVSTDADRAALERIIVAVCRGIEDDAKRSSAVLAAVDGASTPAKVSLIRVLGRLGGAAPLAAVRKAAKETQADIHDAAVRALAGWPDAAPAGDLLEIARKADTLAHHVLALRGLARMAGLPGALPVKLLTDALAAAKRDEEKTMLRIAVEKAHWAMNFTAITPLGKATSPDGLEPDGGSDGDQAAIDGRPDTYWDEQDGAKVYRLVVALPKARMVAAVRIMGYEHQNYSPKDFEVLCDGKVVKKVTGAQYTDNLFRVEFPATECKTLELKITGYYGKSPGVRELEIFAPAQPPGK